MFIPERVFFEREALIYPLGEEIYRRFAAKTGEKIELKIIEKHNRAGRFPGDTPRERFFAAKRTLVVGVRRSLKMAGCRPSADYQLPLSTGCPGSCRYCYLHTTLGKTPSLRLYVNLDEILQAAREHLERRLPQETTFEGSATSDPLALEYLSGALARSITFFAAEEKAYFRFATKQTDVTPLLNLPHGGRTRIRFSLNIPAVERNYERGVPPVRERIEAALLLRQKGYPVGFLLAPIFSFPGWEKEYGNLLGVLHQRWQKAAAALSFPPVEGPDPSFELITHRFTVRAKKNIMELFPETTLPLDEEDGRRFKFGQFGYGKYLYEKSFFKRVEEVLIPHILQLFVDGGVDYLV